MLTNKVAPNKSQRGLGFYFIWCSLLKIILLALLPGFVFAGNDPFGKDELLNDRRIEIVELNGGKEVCSWVAGNLEQKTGEINETYEWVNYKPSQLDSPEDHYGFIKYIYVDIDNDSEKEYLIRTQTYLGGTPSAFDIWVYKKNPFVNSLVSLRKISKTNPFSLKNEGKKKYLDYINSLKKDGVEVVNNDELLYGFSAYELQNSNQIFNYKRRNYIYLNAFSSSLSDGLGLVVEIVDETDPIFSVKEICFLRCLSGSK